MIPLSRRIALALALSLSLHAAVLWGPDIRLPHLTSPLPPLSAKLEALPSAPARHTPARKKPRVRAAPAPVTPPAQVAAAEPQPAANALATASEVAAASAPAATEVPASPTAEAVVERPPLPKHAQLTFAVNKGTSTFRIGKVEHSLEIDDGRYVLQSVTETVGLAKFFKTYRLTQYSSGSYSSQGLQPEHFFEERADRLGAQRNTVDFDHATQLATFSNGSTAPLPPDTQDILSILYQFPPLDHTEIATVSVSNGRKVEHYTFEIATNETVLTALGELSAVRLSKLHQPNEEGLEIWLAREYRLFPVKLRFIEKNGEVAAEAVITDIRVSEEQGVKIDVTN